MRYRYPKMHGYFNSGTYFAIYLLGHGRKNYRKEKAVKITEEYIDKYVAHLKMVYSEWEVENTEWLDKTEKMIDKVVGELEEADSFQPYREVA